MKTVTVRLPEELHRLVKVRCAERGDSMEGVARAAFASYVTDGGLAAGDPRGVAQLSARAASGAQSTGVESRRSEEAESAPSAGSGRAPRTDGSSAASPSGCPGYVPAGVRCKLCGQVHQPKGRKQ